MNQPKIKAPSEIFERLEKTVVDQSLSLQQIAVSLFKHINQLNVGNIMLVGNSGTGKTTIMRAIESMFAKDELLSDYMNTVRMNANLISNDESKEMESSVVISKLRENAEHMLADHPSPERFKSLMENGVVFIDEVDKIRSHVGGQANPRGIVAQEALLTLIEGETIHLSYTYKEQGELKRVVLPIETGHILFICGGAFEGLYDQVYRRVASGEHKDKLVQEFVIEDEDLQKKEHFHLSNYIRYEDMFEYGMTPQFLGRFDEIIILNDLTVKGLMRIFLEGEKSLYRETQAYFKTLGVDMQMTREALQVLAEAAYENHRIGARALRSLFKRVLRGIEFNPANNYLVKEVNGKKQLTMTADFIKRHI
ncbi:MAG: hypothetical protein CSA81_09985 [Acidobacteria bacterium]|nr:MAG: hypothetical protein CSA81_09985 [Acidobacteriota bacterium]PIE90799.1 MAG: hypothetical protein CR997_04020 [Acidobacteriota bacterium]